MKNTESTESTTLSRIVSWNKERQLIKKPEIVNETSFIIEELLEMQTAMKSEEAREVAKTLAEDIREMSAGYQPTPNQVIDAAADIIVFATGIIAKMGFDPDMVMAEVQKEIDSRVGDLDETGKWVKDSSPEAKAKRYKASFRKCRTALKGKVCH